MTSPVQNPPRRQPGDSPYLDALDVAGRAGAICYGDSRCSTCHPYACKTPTTKPPPAQPVPPPPVLEEQGVPHTRRFDCECNVCRQRAGHVVVDQRLVDASTDLGGPAAVIGAAFFVSWMLGLATEPLLCFACSIQSAVIIRLAFLLRGKQQRALTPSPTGLPSTSTAVDER